MTRAKNVFLGSNVVGEGSSGAGGSKKRKGKEPMTQGDNQVPVVHYIPERGIVPPTNHQVNEFPWTEVDCIMQMHSWEPFFVQREPWDRDLCDEFYTALDSWRDHPSRPLKIRGKIVPFSPEGITALFDGVRTEPRADEDVLLHEGGFFPIPEYVASVLCEDGYVHVPGIPSLAYKDLKPIVRFLLKFVIFSLVPVQHDTNIRSPVCNALYFIFTGGFIDIGDLIFHSILDHVGKSLRVFPCVITGLCEVARVPRIRRNQPPYGPLTQRVWSYMAQRPPAQDEAPQEPPAPHAPAPVTTILA